MPNEHFLNKSIVNNDDLPAVTSEKHMRPANFEVKNFLTEQDLNTLPNKIAMLSAVYAQLLQIDSRGSYTITYMKDMKVDIGKIFFTYISETNDHAGVAAQGSEEAYSYMCAADASGKIFFKKEKIFGEYPNDKNRDDLEIQKIINIAETNGIADILVRYKDGHQGKIQLTTK